MEGLAALLDGVHPRSIEVAGLQAGMPVGPLALQDEVSLSLSLHILDQTRKDFAAEGKAYAGHPANTVIEKMVRELDRPGKKAGKRSEEHTSELQSLMRTSYDVFCLQKTKPRENTY